MPKGFTKNNINLDPNSPVPLYKQLSGIIREWITSGKYTHDTKIPTESEFVDMFSISRITVRKALEELNDEGLLIRKKGKGTFVSTVKRVEQKYPFMPFDEAIQAAGKIPTTKLLSYSLEVPPSKVSGFLNIAEADPAIIIKRLRFADQVPVILETDYYLASFTFLSEEPLNGSTFNILQRHNIEAIHGRTTISICASNEIESEYFGMDVDTPLLYVYSEICDQNMRPVQVSKQIIRSSEYKLYLEN